MTVRIPADVGLDKVLAGLATRQMGVCPPHTTLVDTTSAGGVQ